MNVKDALRSLLKGNHHMVKMYLADLSDEDLLVRPVPGANHIAWQLGHLIYGEAAGFQPLIPGAKPVALPAGFAELYGKDGATNDDPGAFLKKAAYLELAGQAREATLAALENLSEADLDQPITGRMASIAPTVGALLLLTGNHDMMHAGQWTVVRRKLGKPVLF